VTADAVAPARREVLRRAAEVLRDRGNAVALTGAGISVESGVPAFRGTQGMWAKYDPMEYASLGGFIRDPEKAWRMLAEMMAVLAAAAPNPAHRGLAALERMDLLRAVVTQNIDGLHQAAGSRRVVEYHGNPETLLCLACESRYPTRERVREGIPPRCDCGRILKPDVVFFGELIPRETLDEAEILVRECDVLLVIGTSAQVAPACDLPRLARDGGAFIIEINPEETALTDTVTDLYIGEGAGMVLTDLVAALQDPAGSA
jgi:NAD-dependent deacetylase